MTKRTLLPLILLAATTAAAAPRHATLLREAVAASQAGEQATALAKIEEAAKLRPDYPRIQMNLARLYAGQQRADDAIAALQRLAAMGVKMNLAAEASLAPLKDLPAFQSVGAKLAAGPAAVGHTEAISLTGVTGIIEGPLLDPATGAWYFSDVRDRCIWRRDAATGHLTKFSHDEDALDGVFKLALSADRKTLWAATASLGVMTGPGAEDGKRSALVAIDFATGRVRVRHPTPDDGKKHLLGDFVVTADGSIYATDTFSPVIWHLPPGGHTLKPWLESDQFLSLQGITASEDGRDLFVADYANGIWRISLHHAETALLTPPANASFFGIDGLYTVPGAILAVQNGVEPQRVLRIEPKTDALSPTRILLVAQPGMTDLALGQVVNGRFHLVGTSGWALFDPPPATPPAPRTVTILSTAIE